MPWQSALVGHNDDTLLGPLSWLGSSLVAAYWVVLRVQGSSVISSLIVLPSPAAFASYLRDLSVWTGSLQQQLASRDPSTLLASLCCLQILQGKIPVQLHCLRLPVGRRCLTPKDTCGSLNWSKYLVRDNSSLASSCKLENALLASNNRSSSKSAQDSLSCLCLLSNSTLYSCHLLGGSNHWLRASLVIA